MAIITISGDADEKPCWSQPDCPKLAIDTDTGHILAVVRPVHDHPRAAEAGVGEGELLGEGLTREMVLAAARRLEAM